MDIVSLGGNCSVAYQLNKLQLRYNSYPFDWCKIDFLFIKLIHTF